MTKPPSLTQMFSPVQEQVASMITISPIPFPRVNLLRSPFPGGQRLTQSLLLRGELRSLAGTPFLGGGDLESELYRRLLGGGDSDLREASELEFLLRRGGGGTSLPRGARSLETLLGLWRRGDVRETLRLDGLRARRRGGGDGLRDGEVLYCLLRPPLRRGGVRDREREREGEAE